MYRAATITIDGDSLSMLELRGKEREGGVGEGAKRTSENEIECIQFVSVKRGVGI